MIKVGTICIGQNFISLPEYNGMECTVIKASIRKWVHKDGRSGVGIVYVVEWVDGRGMWALPENLRPKRPPMSGEMRILSMFKPELIPA